MTHDIDTRLFFLIKYTKGVILSMTQHLGKKDRGAIYLSGGMQYAVNLGAAWREDCSRHLRNMGYFPLDITELDVAYSKKHGELYSPDRTRHLEFKSDIRKHFIQTDLNLIKNVSDALIVLYDESARRGAGTISECQYAYNLNLPIFVVSVYDDIYQETPGWLQGLCTKLVGSFDELYKYLDELPYGILRKDIYGNNRANDQYLCSLCGCAFTKRKNNFVSKVTPLYCHNCVKTVTSTNEDKADRYEFFIDYLTEQGESGEKPATQIPNHPEER